MMDCINLKDRFGGRYRVVYEESYFAEHGQTARADDPWLQVLLCQHGHIYPHGGELLAAATDKRGGIAKKLAALDCTTVVQDGSDGANVVFPVEHFDEVARIMKARKRRRLSPEHRRKLTEAAAKYRLTRGSEAANSALECDSGVAPVSLDLPAANEANSGPFPEVTG